MKRFLTPNGQLPESERQKTFIDGKLQAFFTERSDLSGLLNYDIASRVLACIYEAPDTDDHNKVEMTNNGESLSLQTFLGDYYFHLAFQPTTSVFGVQNFRPQLASLKYYKDSSFTVEQSWLTPEMTTKVSLQQPPLTNSYSYAGTLASGTEASIEGFARATQFIADFKHQIDQAVSA